MQVYQKIKKMRQNLGLRQIDMVSGVIDVSFYSRIERGEVKMRAINLIEILRTHDMSIVSFMNQRGFRPKPWLTRSSLPRLGQGT